MSEAPDVGGLVGSMLAGRYRVLKKLGEGAMGAVYMAEHTRIGRKDAIKVLRDNLARDPEAVARFLRGTRNLSAIRHPNVCTIYDFTETDDGLRFMAMEYVEGPTLKEVLDREGTLPLERAVDIARQIADGLQAAHDLGIVHRDLKPGNIMLLRGRGGRDLVKVVDFDIAKGPDEGGDEVTRTGFVVGTPEYMSPEQLMGEPLDGRSDVYALALVLYRMLAGQLPFRAEGTQDIMIARLTQSPMSLADARPGLIVPAGLQRALDRALQRKPADRQANADAFGDEIVASLRDAPSPVPPPASRPGADVPPTTVAPAYSGTAHASGDTVVAAPPLASAGRGRVALLSGVGAAAVAIVGIILITRPADPAAGGGTTPAPIPLPPPETTIVVDDQVSPGTGGQPDSIRVADAGSSDSGTGTNDRTTPVPPPAPPPPPPEMSGEEVVDRYLILTDGVAPSQSRLPGIADTLNRAYRREADAGTRRSLALLLAYVEYYRRDNAACRRWIDEVERLGAPVAPAVRDLCSTEEP